MCRLRRQKVTKQPKRTDLTNGMETDEPLSGEWKLPVDDQTRKQKFLAGTNILDHRHARSQSKEDAEDLTNRVLLADSSTSFTRGL